jgi:hypothetical protein
MCEVTERGSRTAAQAQRRDEFAGPQVAPRGARGALESDE